MSAANVVVEGRVYDHVTNGPVPNAIVISGGSCFKNTIPESLERVELLEFHIGGGRQLMLRAHTRTFFQEPSARNQPLQAATMSLLGREFVYR